jgi:acetyltransferase-like isoleucine patch superfamily enzyme
VKPVFLPILDANMTHGVVRAWLKREGDMVHAGDPLFEVETDKVNAEVEAETSGVLRLIVTPVGSRVPVLGLLAFIGAADEAVPAAETWGTLVPRAPLDMAGSASPSVPEPARAAAATVESGPIAASPAARRLARERGLALEQITGTGRRGEITRADVEAAAAAGPRGGGAGQMDAAFLDVLRRDPAAFRALSSETKVRLYREHGAQIGEHVRIEPGAIIVAHEISIGTAATIGADSTIECQRLRLGRLAAFGKRTRVHSRVVEIGDALWSKDDVVIGGGGSDEPGARLQAGDACFFGEGAYLNTGHPLTLGDEVCIGSRAMLFTHSHWQSILRGYPSIFGPIAVGDHVFIGNTAFIFPGVTIGAGTTVMVNSFVAQNVPANTFVGGVPAAVVRHLVPPSRAEQVAIVRERLMPELAVVLGERGHHVAQRIEGETITLDVGGAARIHYVPVWESAAAVPVQQRTVILSFAEALPAALATSVTLFDLHGGRVVGVQDRLSDEVRELCRRRGIRFRPFAWRYRVGHCEGDRFFGRGRD